MALNNRFNVDAYVSFNDAWILWRRCTIRVVETAHVEQNKNKPTKIELEVLNGSDVVHAALAEKNDGTIRYHTIRYVLITRTHQNTVDCAVLPSCTFRKYLWRLFCNVQ